jgi:hypothetical protein
MTTVDFQHKDRYRLLKAQIISVISLFVNVAAMGVTHHFLLDIFSIPTSAIIPALNVTKLDMNFNK